MTLDEVMKVVEESFDYNVYSTAVETVLGLESHVEGKEDFLTELYEKLKKLEGEK